MLFDPRGYNTGKYMATPELVVDQEALAPLRQSIIDLLHDHFLLPQYTYTPEEAEIVARMWQLVNRDIYQFTRVRTLSDPRGDVPIPDSTMKRRREIIDEVQALVENILGDRNKREKHFTVEDFYSFNDAHWEMPDYAFLQEQPETINVNAWRFFAGLLNPVDIGIKIGPSEAVVHATGWKKGR